MPGCPNPVFIGGCPRSGTTALWNALKQHPHLGPAPDKWQDKELWFFGELLERRDEQNEARRTHSLDQIFIKEAVEFINDFMTRYGSSPSGRYLAAYVKNIFYAREILRHIPDAKFLFVVRHPQENVWSLLNSFFAVGFIRKNRAEHLITEDEIAKATHLWKKAANVVLEALRGEFGKSVWVVRQENMVLKPVIVAQEVLEFVEEPFEQAVADSLVYGIINSSFSPDREPSETSFLHVVQVQADEQREAYFERIRSQIAARRDVCSIVSALAGEEMRLLRYEDYASQSGRFENIQEVESERKPRAAEVVNVIVTDADNIPRDTFNPNEIAVLQVTVQANENITNPSVSYFVRDEEQNRLFGTTTFDEYISLPTLAKGERLKVAFRFNQALRIGRYHVGVAFNSVSSRMYTDNVLHHEIEDACEFRVDYSPMRPIHYMFYNPASIQFAKV